MKAVFTFGRFNPPTIGHKKVIETIMREEGDQFVFLSHSFDSNKNPLTFEEKCYFMENFFPNVKICKENIRTPFEAAKYLSDNGYTDVKMVVGSDRLTEFKKNISAYIKHPDKTKSFNFEKFDVISSGERIDEDDGVAGASGSKARKYVLENNFEEFSRLVPVNNKLAEELYKTLKKRLGAELMSETERMRNLIKLMENPGPTDGAMISPYNELDAPDEAREEAKEKIGDYIRADGKHYILDLTDWEIDKEDKIELLQDLFNEVQGVVGEFTEEMYNNYDLFSDTDIRDMMKEVFDEMNIVL